MILYKRVIVDTEVADPPVAGGDDGPPRNLRISLANGIGDMGCHFADQFQITYGGGISTWARNNMCPP